VAAAPGSDAGRRSPGVARPRGGSGQSDEAGQLNGEAERGQR